MRAMTNGTNCFNGMSMTEGAWDAILEDLNDNTSSTGITFHGGGAIPSAAGAADRAALEARTPGWIITDGDG